MENKPKFLCDINETIKKFLAKHGDAADANSAKLVKIGLPKQLIEESLKETSETEKC